MSLITMGYAVDPAAGEGLGHGFIEIEPERWQLVAIPIQYGYWDDSAHALVHDGTTVARVKNYVMDQIADIMGGPAENFISVANAYFGDDDAFRNYVPGVTNPASDQNFPLTYEDVDGSTEYEVTGFWLKSIHTATIRIEWGEA